MKRDLAFLLLGALAVGLLLGCASEKKEAVEESPAAATPEMAPDMPQTAGEEKSGGWETLAYSAAERNRRIERTFEHNFKEIVDDIDLLLWIDRPSRLSKWYVR